MKVYVLQFDVVYEYETVESFPQTRLFVNKDEAQKAFDDWRWKERSLAENREWKIDSDENNYFSSYDENDGYAMTHTIGSLMEFEI